MTVSGCVVDRRKKQSNCLDSSFLCFVSAVCAPPRASLAWSQSPGSDDKEKNFPFHIKKLKLLIHNIAYTAAKHSQSWYGFLAKRAVALSRVYAERIFMIRSGDGDGTKKNCKRKRKFFHIRQKKKLFVCEQLEELNEFWFLLFAILEF